MATQAMEHKKKEGTSYHSEYDDYEKGKPRDKKQKKLKEWTKENDLLPHPKGWGI